MALQLSLHKGGPAPKLALNLSKGGSLFFVELGWDSKHDLDAHALLTQKVGGQAKVTKFEQVLSVYLLQTPETQALIVKKSDGSFSTQCGALSHSGDKRDGTTQGVDEIVTIDTARVAPEVDEIPIFVTIHEAAKKGASFAQVKTASITIKDEAGKVLGSYELTSEFASYDAVQMGSIMRTATGGWEYAAVGSGFNGDFNAVLAHFS